MERYVITWRPIVVRAIVALIGGSTVALGYKMGVELILAAGFAMLLGCLIPSVRDVRRDGARSGALPSREWWLVVAAAVLIRGLASELGLLARLGDTMNAVLVLTFATAMLMPVSGPRLLWGARRADGIAARCPRCRYDMNGVPGAACPECGQDCGADRVAS